ncbi:MAG: transposase [Cenarchaeum sp. SB0664_bin_35]|nr:transposase [Cenarchaeum sp. SB0664_bin_35]
MIHNILDMPDDTGLNAVTGCRFPVFEYIYSHLLDKIKDSKDAPLFTIPGHRESEPGIRRKLPLKIALVMALYHMYTNCTQQYLAALFSISQSTVSRYQDVLNKRLCEILPTPEWTAKVIAGASTYPEVKKILQGKENATIFIDGTHIRTQRSSDYTTQKENYSGKKKFHSKNVLMITTNNGMIIGISRPFDGKTHDMKVLKNDFPDLGRWLESMKDPNTPKSERILVYSDTGYVGIEEVFPGIKSEQPTKKSKNRELTQEQKDENRLIGSERVTVEHPISHFAVLGGTFRGNTNHIFTYFLIASGIINIRIMFRDFELWAHMNRITSRMNIKPIPLPSDDLMKTAEYIEKTAGPKRELHKQQMAEWRKKTADARAAATP